MPRALLGATICGRCGAAAAAPSCPSCGLAWLAAADGRVGLIENGPLTGVSRAAVGRRCVADGLDLLPIVALGLLAVLAATTTPSLGAAWLYTALAIIVVAGQLAAWAGRGRSLGRLLLRLRTVDDLAGTPVGARRWLRRVGQPGWLRRVMTADLRRGRDPIEPVLGGPDTHGAAPVDRTYGVPRDETVGVAHRRNAGEAAPILSVGIVLANGERYEIFRSLLLGRSPSDPNPDGTHALLAWPDLSRRLAKTHVLLEWSSGVLWVTDLHTTTGTTLIAPDGESRPLAPGVRTAATVGTTIDCGGRTVQVVPGG